MQGKIVKGIAGFYYVKSGEKTYECKAKGVFRKDHRKPLVGDDVELDILDEEKNLGNIREILPRKNELIRPAVANVDQAMVIFAMTSPQPNLNLLDRFLVMMRQQDMPCLICFNKLDLDRENLAEYYKNIYENCGYPVKLVSTVTREGIPQLREWLEGKTTTLAGPSGVGKSSLINTLLGESTMEIGGLSQKIDRGKHTTRHSELLCLERGKESSDEAVNNSFNNSYNDSFIFDTPGFSSLDLFDMEKEDLAYYYPEFEPYEQYCRFGGCSHVTEPVCGVRDAVAEGKVAKIRYENYCQMYQELKGRKKY